MSSEDYEKIPVTVSANLMRNLLGLTSAKKIYMHEIPLKRNSTTSFEDRGINIDILEQSTCYNAM